MADPLSTAIGLITSTIQLERQIQDIIERYHEAPKVAQSIRVFGLGFDATRLHYIEQLLRAQRNQQHLRTESIPDLEQGVRALHEGLARLKAYFEQREPNSTIPKFWWVIRAEKKLKGLQQDLHQRLNNVAGLLQLVSTASRETSEPLEALTSPIFHRYGVETEVLEGLCRSTAHYLPHDARFVQSYNPTVHVLIERYYLKNLGSGSKNAQQTTRHLREISDADPNTLGSYHTGLLPCIGYRATDQHGAQKLISLLPRNMSVTEPPRSLRQMILDTKDPNTSLAVTLEARFHMALQLARALLAIHTAGFSNCSIRSDKILFVLPLQDGEEEVRDTQAPDKRDAQAPNQRDVPDTNVPGAAVAEAQKPTLIRRLTGRFLPETNVPGAGGNEKPTLVRRLTGRYMPDSKDKLGNKGENYNDKNDSKKDLRKRPSARSLRSFRGAKGKRAEKEVPPAAPKPLPDNSILETGAVPPGGGVFLAYWSNMREHTAGPTALRKDWHKDLYRHPLVQGGEEKYFGMGHEVYALGVCLLEIGLWDALIWKDESGLFHTSDILGERLKTLAKEHERRSRMVPRIRENPTKAGEQSGPEILERLMRKTTGPEYVKQMLIEIATRELPKLMGNGYSKVVEACLRCMDDGNTEYWNVDFRQEEMGQGHIGLRERFCNAIDIVLVSMLSNLYTNMSAEGF